MSIPPNGLRICKAVRWRLDSRGNIQLPRFYTSLSRNRSRIPTRPGLIIKALVTVVPVVSMINIHKRMRQTRARNKLCGLDMCRVCASVLASLARFVFYLETWKDWLAELN